MPEINWYVWAALWLVAWFWQNMAHELSHVWAGWVWEGRKPIKLIPWMHMHKGRWYWSRYESGLATKSGSPRHRHWAPMQMAITQAVFAVIGIVWALAASEVLDWSDGQGFAIYLIPVAVCPMVDAGVWLWGCLMRRPGTDGDRWIRQIESERQRG